MKLLMISGDRSLAEGKRGAFYYMLEEFRQYWERIDIIIPKIRNPKFEIRNNFQNSKLEIQKIFENVFIYPADCGILGQPWFIKKKGAELYKERKYNLITVHEYPPFYNGVGARWLYNKIKAPYVVEYHHIVGYPRAADFKERFYKFLYQFFAPYVCAKAKLIRVVNEKQSREFLEKLGVDKDKIKNIGSQYIDLEVFRPIDLEKKYDLVFAGRLVKNKNLGMLVDAVKSLKSKVKSQIQSPKLAIIGDGPEAENLKSKVKSQKLENNIEFMGWLPSAEDVARVYNQSKIFVMPSLNEGGPRVCLEAMACGVPVVTTRIGVMLDIIRDGENGTFCDWTAEDMAGKIIKIQEYKNIKIMGERAREAVMRFERKEMIKKLAEGYQEIINKVDK